jgi:ribonuclease-3 family protein
MEQSIEQVRKQLMDILQIEPVDIRTYSPLALAFIGDGVYELVVRTLMIHQGNMQANKLQKKSSFFAKAITQSVLVQAILDELTPEEFAVYRRGVNSKPHSKAKNASIQEYLEATGLEALVGYLYLTGQVERMLTLIRKGMDAILD